MALKKWQRDFLDDPKQILLW
jgi:hypothetical protein